MQIYGIGTDIVSVPRIAASLSRHGNAFLEKIFTPFEIERLPKDAMLAQRVAARFSAKEAVVKAFGNHTQLYLQDIEILKHESGAPYARVRGQHDATVMLSYSHTEEYATATAIVFSGT
jgi:holo-[acyl-carrier protein] synthase